MAAAIADSKVQADSLPGGRPVIEASQFASIQAAFLTVNAIETKGDTSTLIIASNVIVDCGPKEVPQK